MPGVPMLTARQYAVTKYKRQAQELAFCILRNVSATRLIVNAEHRSQNPLTFSLPPVTHFPESDAVGTVELSIADLIDEADAPACVDR
jgi:hypothetical protein